MRILLVDDEADIREALAAGLHLAFGEELHVDLAANAAEARARLQQAPPYDLVLADEKMPGESGSEFLGWLREQHPGTERVLMSAYPRGSLGEAEAKAAPALVVRKPFAFQALVADLRRLLEDPVKRA